MWGWILLAVAAVIVIWGISGYNGFVSLRNKCEESYSTMDVYLKKRYDLIPNLVETVKGFAAHESGTLEKVIQARNAAMSATNPEEKLRGENVLQSTLRSLFALSEAYPDLKANTNFLDLQGQLKSLEEDIANSRKYYNAIVKQFNTKTETFPSLILANIFGFKRWPMFEVSDASERENVRVQF